MGRSKVKLSGPVVHGSGRSSLPIPLSLFPSLFPGSYFLGGANQGRPSNKLSWRDMIFGSDGTGERGREGGREGGRGGE